MLATMQDLEIRLSNVERMLHRIQCVAAHLHLHVYVPALEIRQQSQVLNSALIVMPPYFICQCLIDRRY